MSVEDRTVSATDDFADTVNGAARSARGKVNEATGAARAKVNDAAKRAERAVQDGLKVLKERSGDYSARIDDAQHVVVEHVREHPLSSTLAVFGVGVVLGLLLGRRN